MKNTFQRMTAALWLLVMLLVCSVPESAKAQTSTVWGGGTTNGASTLSWIIVPAKSGNNGVPLVTLINATSDKASSVVQSYLVTTNTGANYVSTTTSIPVYATNGFASGDVIVIRHLGEPEGYEKRTLTTFTSGTNLTVTVAPITALAVGDLVYRVTTTGAAKIPVGNATLSLSGAGLLSGQRLNGAPAPLLLEVDSTTTGTFNAVNAIYYP